MKRKMIADGKIMQDGVWLKPRDEFECDEEDVATLVMTGLAHPDVVVKRTYRRRDMEAEK